MEVECDVEDGIVVDGYDIDVSVGVELREVVDGLCFNTVGEILSVFDIARPYLVDDMSSLSHCQCQMGGHIARAYK